MFTGGYRLYEAKKQKHHNVHAFPSSIDALHFRQARTIQEEPEDQTDIPHPRLGFAGVIDERLDIRLLDEIASLRPDWHFVMLGPVVKIQPQDLPQRPNIRYLGAKDYKQLPAYMSGWDVGLLPFARNESTRFISPTKTPEYLAAGLPVVSTYIRDVARPYAQQRLVRIANSAEAFTAACQRALASKEDMKRIRKADAFLSKNSWDITWERMNNLLSAVVVLKGGMRSLRTGTVGSVSSGLGSDFRVYRVNMFDYLIVGAGFAARLAERLARVMGKQVVICDKRPHIGGNAFDHYNEHGILVHRYGPQYLHTNSQDVFDYLSQFTEWRTYEHHVLASVEGQLVSMPINLEPSINAMVLT